MRLIAWNVNYNNRRRPLEEVLALLKPFDADVLVLSESAEPISEHPERVQWIGDGAPGLAVVAGEGLTLVPSALNAGAPPWVGGYRVDGRVSFDLVAAWPTLRSGGATYHALLLATLDRYASLLSGTHAMLAGDLNSSSGVSNQKRTHPVFVKRAEQLGLVSAYHHQSGEPHGAESVATYRHGGRGSGEFHLDYCFVSKPLLAATRIRIIHDDAWSKRSDHYPLVVDIPDEALPPTAD